MNVNIIFALIILCVSILAVANEYRMRAYRQGYDEGWCVALNATAPKYHAQYCGHVKRPEWLTPAAPLTPEP
jgi:hypothetical protein